MLKGKFEPRYKIVAMPSHTNPAGNIFGGWLLSCIDLAGSIAARELAPERVVTISMKEVVFKEPVFVDDIVSCYAEVSKVGNTSITVQVEVVVERLTKDNVLSCIPVTEAIVTYVSVDKQGNKKPISQELKKLRGF